MGSVKRVLSFLLCIGMLVLLIPATTTQAAPSQAEVDEKIRWIIASIPDSCDTDYEKALWLHDYLCMTVAYKEGLPDYAYTALINGVADCGGYSDAYMELLRAAGINCATVTGGAAGDPHGWNIVILDGKCYFTDVTWDDYYKDRDYRFNFISRKYFMLSFEEMEKDHRAAEILDSSVYRLYLPDACNHTDLSYTYKHTGQPGSGHFNDSTTPEEAVRHFKVIKVNGSTVTWRCDFQFDGNAADWITANNFQIGKLLGGYLDVRGGWDGYGVLVYSGNIDFTPTQSLAFTKSTVYLNNSQMRQQLSVNFTPANASYQDVTYTSSDSRIAKVDENGVVRAVSSGTATITATALDGKTATCQVVVDHPHNAIRYVPAVTANCMQNGNIAHYICDSCGTMFSDSNGNSVITPGDAVLHRTTYCIYGNCSVYHNAEGHWQVCDICNKWYFPNISPHEDWTGDGICDGYNVNMPCGYVMNPSATNPNTTRPQTTPSTTAPATVPATTPAQPTTAPTQPTSAPLATETATSPTPPTLGSIPPATEPEATPGSSHTVTVPNSSASPSPSPKAVQPEHPLPLQWIVLGLIGITAILVITVGICRRKKS